VLPYSYPEEIILTLQKSPNLAVANPSSYRLPYLMNQRAMQVVGLQVSTEKLFSLSPGDNALLTPVSPCCPVVYFFRYSSMLPEHEHTIGGIEKSRFFEDISTRGLEQMVELFWQLYGKAAKQLLKGYNEKGYLTIFDGSLQFLTNLSIDRKKKSRTDERP
jgi:hypothetical protein